jgi:hypothetical protein
VHCWDIGHFSSNRSVRTSTTIRFHLCAGTLGRNNHLVVTESDARSTIFEHTFDPAKAPDTRDEARAKRERDALMVRVYGEPEREVWRGTAYELARKVREEVIQSGKDVNARKVFTTALQKACDHYSKPDGSLYTHQSLRQSLRQFEEWEDERKLRRLRRR